MMGMYDETEFFHEPEKPDKEEIERRIRKLVDERGYNLWHCMYSITRYDHSLTDKDVADVYHEMYKVLPRHQIKVKDTNMWTEEL
jgi:hypothetical protein